MIEEWSAARVGDVHDLVTAALPDEGLTVDELHAICWDDPGAVLATADGSAVAVAVTRAFGAVTLGWVQLLVVHPGARREGRGAAVLAASEQWCRGAGARQVRFGGSAPWYLWPGIDVRWTAGLCLGEAAGYRPEGAEVNLACPTSVRAPVPAGVGVTRVLADDEAGAVVAWCGEHWPQWVPELERAIEQGGALVARRDPGGAVLGFACHSVNRAGWVGPMATRSTPERRVPGTGAALLGAVCRDLMVAGYSEAEIAWVGPLSFYVKAAGARVSRVFRSVVKDLG